jgi:ComF family protein
MGEILQLLFPERCVGCGASPNAGDLLCRKCAGEWLFPIHNKIEDIHLISSAYYSQSISHIVLKAKENNDSRARQVLAQAIASEISSHIGSQKILLPIPSSSAANRRRGFDHAYLLAREVAYLTGCKVWQGLRANRKVKDQTRLLHDQRFTNLSGAYSLNLGNEMSEGIVLVDDLVTSGASLREAIRALKTAEIAPDAAVSACIATHHLPNTIST